MPELMRYALIDTKMPREFVLLQGKGCVWKRCTFCDYHNDVSGDPFAVNAEVLAQVTGEMGVLDVINSGSCPELDDQTIAKIGDIVREKQIHTLWFEAHYLYREKLQGFAARFPGTEVKFRTGVETFDPILRESWRKGIAKEVTLEEIKRWFSGVCLLFGIEGQRFETVQRDIELALEHFEYFSLNAFVENTTGLRRDDELIARVARECLPKLRDLPGVEVLLENTDLGVG